MIEYNSFEKELIAHGWKETHGIALWTHPEYPDMGVDTNSDQPCLLPVRAMISGAMDDFHAFPDTYEELERHIARVRQTNIGKES